MAGEAGGLRVPRAGLAPGGRPCWLTQSVLFVSERPACVNRGAAADELGGPVEAGPPGAAGGPRVARLAGADALEAAAALRRVRREERFARSSLDALSAPAPSGACLGLWPLLLRWALLEGAAGEL